MRRALEAQVRCAATRQHLHDYSPNGERGMRVQIDSVNALGQTYTTASIGSLDANTVMAPARFRPTFSFDGK